MDHEGLVHENRHLSWDDKCSIHENKYSTLNYMVQKKNLVFLNRIKRFSSMKIGISHIIIKV